MQKFCGNAQFPQSFGQFAQNSTETVPFHKTSTLEKLGATSVFHVVETFREFPINCILNQFLKEKKWANLTKIRECDAHYVLFSVISMMHTTNKVLYMSFPATSEHKQNKTHKVLLKN